MGRAVLAGVVVALVTGVSSASAQTVPPPPPPIPPPPAPAPASWILVDAETGAVLEAHDARTPRRPASTVKLFTALVALERLKPNSKIPVSKRAEGMPARKINMKAGQRWDLEDSIHTLLLVSANDAAVALAERAGGGSLAGWDRVAARTARRLGLRDSPKLWDPAGLDDEFAHRGGSLVSARDLAIIARAAMAQKLIVNSVVLPVYRFTGGDRLPHRLLNHNLFLRLYPGADGMKTGYTRQAGRAFVATATRNGRTMLGVLLGAPDPYGFAAQLLDRGFAIPVRAQKGRARLPDVVKGAARDPAPAPVTTLPATPAALTPTGTSGRGGGAGTTASIALLMVGGIPALVILRRRQVIARRARARARAQSSA